MKVFNIKWDTEDNGTSLPQEELNLPSEIDIDDEELIAECAIDGKDDIPECIADYLSDNYGYCVMSFQYESQVLYET